MIKDEFSSCVAVHRSKDLDFQKFQKQEQVSCFVNNCLQCKFTNIPYLGNFRH